MPLDNRGYARLTRTLTRLYQREPFVRHGVAHPVTVLQPSAAQINDVDSLLDPFPPAPAARDFAVYDYGYLHDLQNSKPSLYNGATFTMKRIRERPLTMRGQLGRYFDMLATCAAMEREMRDAAEAGLLRAPARAAYHRHVAAERALFDGAMRSAAIGIGVLTVFNDGETYRALLARRSHATAFDSHMLHVLPAMMFGPASAGFSDKRDWSVKRQILRELLEELFGLQERNPPLPWERLQDQPALRYLLDMLESGRARLRLTGLILNFLTLRPEISALLIIHDSAWHARVTDAGGDMPLVTAAETQAGSLVMPPITSDAEFLARFPRDLHLSMPPQATATLWLGIDQARREIASLA